GALEDLTNLGRLQVAERVPRELRLGHIDRESRAFGGGVQARRRRFGRTSRTLWSDRSRLRRPRRHAVTTTGVPSRVEGGRRVPCLRPLRAKNPAETRAGRWFV